MKFLKSNILSIVTMSLLFTVVMLGDAFAVTVLELQQASWLNYLKILK